MIFSWYAISNKKNDITLELLIKQSDTFSCFNLAAASPYAGFIALQCPHPAHKNNHVKYHYSIPSLSNTIITDIKKLNKLQL